MIKIGKLIGGGICSAIAICAALVTMYMNAQHGLASVSAAAGVIAVLYVLCDCSRVTMMLLHGFGHKHRLIVPALFVFGAISLIAALSYYTDSTAGKILSAENGNAKAERADGEYQRLTAELERITETTPATSLKTLVAAAQKKLDDAETVAKRAGIKCIQRKACREAETELKDVTGRLGKAERKAELEARLQKVSVTVNETPKTTMSGSALLLVRLAGLDEAKTALWVELAQSILLIIAAEFAVYLGLIGFPMVAQGLGMVEQVIEETLDVPSAVVETLPLSRKDEALQRLLALILSAEGGRLNTSGRTLAKTIRQTGIQVSDSTFAKWLAEWQDQGKIVIREVNGHMSQFSVAA